MPIEIKEFSIKVNTSDTSKQVSEAPKGNTSKIKKEAIINECLEQIFELMNNKKER